MKKIISLFAVIALLSSACSKSDEPADGSNREMVKVTIRTEATRTVLDGTTTHWVAGDQIGLFLYNGSTTEHYPFTADSHGHYTEFTGSIPVGTYQIAAGYYPYGAPVTFDAVNHSYNYTGAAVRPQALNTYDFMFTDVISESFTVTQSSTVLPIHLYFRPLMARINVTVNNAGTQLKNVCLEAPSAIFPTAGVIRNGEFTATAWTNKLTYNATATQFQMGLLPYMTQATINATVTTPDGFTYKNDKVMNLAGFQRNYIYKMAITATQKVKEVKTPTTPGFSDKYGRGTYGDNKLFQIDPALDPEGVFTDWYFRNTEIKTPDNSSDGDRLHADRFVMKVPSALFGNNAAFFCTPAISTGGAATKTVKVTYYFGVGNLTSIYTGTYYVGVIKAGTPITVANLLQGARMDPKMSYTYRNNGDYNYKTYERIFTISEGDRISVATDDCGAGGHIELGNFTMSVY